MPERYPEQFTPSSIPMRGQEFLAWVRLVIAGASKVPKDLCRRMFDED